MGGLLPAVRRVRYVAVSSAIRVEIPLRIAAAGVIDTVPIRKGLPASADAGLAAGDVPGAFRLAS